MNNSLKLAVSAIYVAAILGSASANTTVFSFDEFYINKNGSEIFRDSFSDGVAPGSGPDDGILGPSNTYTVFGGGFSEQGTGKLLVDSAAGGLTSNPNGDARLFNRIRRNHSTNPVSSAHLGAGIIGR